MQVGLLHSGTTIVKDTTSKAIRNCVTNVELTHNILRSVAGLHPYPMMVSLPSIVGWRTKSIRRNTELPKEDSLDEKYPHIVYEERCKASDGEQRESISTDDGLDKLEEELVIGLSRLTWEKVEVSFHRSKLKFAAHSVIQVKEHYMHSEGATVILHMIDHLLR